MANSDNETKFLDKKQFFNENEHGIKGMSSPGIYVTDEPLTGYKKISCMCKKDWFLFNKI